MEAKLTLETYFSAAESQERARQKESESRIKIYDAVEEDLPTPQRSGFKAKLYAQSLSLGSCEKLTSIAFSIPSTGDDDDLMNNFVPMLQEYLTRE